MKKSYLNDRFFSRLEALAFNLRSNLAGYFGGKHLVRTYGQTVEFDFAINAPVVRTECYLKVTTAEVGDAPWKSGDASLRQWQAKPTLYELVPLRMANPE